MAIPSPPRYFVYVASAGDNEILVLGMDSATEPPAILQKLDLKKHAAGGGVSTPMALSRDRRFLYVALRTPPLPLVAFSVDPIEGRLTEAGSARLPASAPYILTDRTGRFLFSVANPGATLAVSRIDEAGRPAGRAHQVLHIGHKLHCVAIDESNRFVCVSSTDDGLIHQFRFDAATGLLEPGDPPSVVLEDGGDPRHMAFSPDGRFVYVTTEAGGRVACFAVDRASGRLNEQPGADMMPAAFSGHPGTADIHVTPDGRYLYATERALSRIVGYRVNQATGALTPIGDTPTEPVPRAFAIAPDGGFLLVAGEASGKLRTYAIDPVTGALAAGVEIAVGAKPNWIELVEPARPTAD
jgi:6-phosphogluconolactonase